MAKFEKVPFPDMPTFYITDNFGHTAELNAEEAYDLLGYLYQCRDELFQALYPKKKQRTPIDDLTIEELTLEFMNTRGSAYQEHECHFCHEKYNAMMHRYPTCFTPKKQEEAP